MSKIISRIHQIQNFMIFFGQSYWFNIKLISWKIEKKYFSNSQFHEGMEMKGSGRFFI